MKVDLKSMTRRELEKLGADVEKALDKMRKKDLKKVRAEMEKLAAAHGVTVQDIMGNKAAPKAAVKKAPKAKAAPKYANPSDKSQTWSGRGRQPEWFKTAVMSGTSPDSLEI